MLPDEVEFTNEVRRRYDATFSAMGRLHNAAVALLSPEGLNAQCPKYADSAVQIASISLYVKACKQFRSIQILCERGMGSDADSLVRNLFETTVYLVFVLKPRVTLRKDGNRLAVPGNRFPSKLRARLYLAYTTHQLAKTVKAWARTGGLTRLAATGRDQADQVSQQMQKQIGPEWSKRQRDGRGVAGVSLLHLAESLGLSREYAMVYRTGSRSVHAMDPLSHVDFHYNDAPISFVFWPSIDSIQQHIMGAFMCLGICMDYLNSRFRLGRDDVIDVAKQEHTLLGRALNEDNTAKS